MSEAGAVQAPGEDRPLRGRVALVTGGSRGLGRALCVMLAACGADVAFTYRKRADEAGRTLELIGAVGGRAVASLSSVDSAADNERAVAEAVQALGPVDILVNNAGIVSSGMLVADTAAAEFRRLMDVHAFGPAQLCQLVLPYMRAAGRGDVIMISSVAVVDFEPRAAPYTMAKCAQEALAWTLAAEERGNGIRVNVVAPGLIDTDMGRRLVNARPDDFPDEPSTPEQVASAVQGVLCDPGVTGCRFAVSAGSVTSAAIRPSLRLFQP
jgi:NAD(P)-dependent dehydrogenase (short-subunit alcohol dehydrogenase family)